MPLRVLLGCPECKRDFYVEAWQVLDFGQAPDLRRQFLQAKINLASCPNCGQVFVLDMPFLVNDPKCKRVIFFVPGPPGRADPVSVQMLRNTLGVAFARKKPYFKQPLVVSEWEELVRLVAEGADRTDAE
jgi:hypothetical protein